MAFTPFTQFTAEMETVGEYSTVKELSRSREFSRGCVLSPLELLSMVQIPIISIGILFFKLQSLLYILII